MESKTCGHGRSSGFTTLLSKRYANDEGAPLRLAYLQVLKEIPAQPIAADGQTPMDAGGSGTYRFYELWNEPVWNKMAEDVEASPWEALLAGLADGSITMHKIIRIPGSPNLRSRIYNTQAATVEAVDENDCVNLFALPKDITITGHLAGTTNEILPARPPIPPPSADDHPVRVYVVKVDGKAVARVPESMLDKLPDTIRDLKLTDGQTITVTG